MLADISNVDAIYLVCGRTDMRLSLIHIFQTEKYQYLFQCAKESNDFHAFMKLAG